MNFKTAILINNGELEKWQADALSSADFLIDIILIFNCQNAKVKNFSQSSYFLKLFEKLTDPNDLRKTVKWDHRAIEIINFDPEAENEFELIPKNLVKRLLVEKIDILINFGLPCLKVTKDFKSVNILEYEFTKNPHMPLGGVEIINDQKLIDVFITRQCAMTSRKLIASMESIKVCNYSINKTKRQIYECSKKLLFQYLKKIDICEDTGLIYSSYKYDTRMDMQISY